LIASDVECRIPRLVLLASDIVEAILSGRTDQGMMLEQVERPLPACWEEQRHVISARMSSMPRRWKRVDLISEAAAGTLVDSSRPP
jgi:hypothetical protein